jgi:hypothetical protein
MTVTRVIIKVLGADVMDQTLKKLWSAVLNQAIKDAQEIHSVYAEDARSWFSSKSQGTGSFIWICLILDLDPDAFRSVYQESEVVSYADTPQRAVA